MKFVTDEINYFRKSYFYLLKLCGSWNRRYVKCKNLKYRILIGLNFAFAFFYIVAKLLCTISHTVTQVYHLKSFKLKVFLFLFVIEF